MGSCICVCSENPLNKPPFSRIFIESEHDFTEEQLRQHFGTYGKIENCHIVKDKQTGQCRGIYFVKFSLASSAALAVESENANSDVKVYIAQSKDVRIPQSLNPLDVPPRSRVFVKCDKNLTEEDLTRKFQAFGSITNAIIMKNLETKTSKGFGFVKFTKSSDALKATEALCNGQDWQVPVMLPSSTLFFISCHL
jgi:RNA recognition motif-containing protein